MSTINNATLEGSTSALLFTGCPLARSWRAALSTREIDKVRGGLESSVLHLYIFNLGREDSRRALGDQETRHRLREVQGREQPAAVVLGSSQRGLNICRPDGLDAGRHLSEQVNRRPGVDRVFVAVGVESTRLHLDAVLLDAGVGGFRGLPVHASRKKSVRVASKRLDELVRARHRE